jgi:hypothetical protein
MGFGLAAGRGQGNVGQSHKILIDGSGAEASSKDLGAGPPVCRITEPPKKPLTSRAKAVATAESAPVSKKTSSPLCRDVLFIRIVALSEVAMGAPLC